MNYIKIPSSIKLSEVIDKNYSLSASQHKQFSIKNKNVVPLKVFLAHDFTEKDKGKEVGSSSYYENGPYRFIKTKALQKESFLLSIDNESYVNIIPQQFVDNALKEGDVIISKDSNVGEVIILDRDYPEAMLSSALYKLPLNENKYYALAMIKSNLFREQIDFLIPRGSTIRHGKTKFLDCLIPLPNKNYKKTIEFIELLCKAIIRKEIAIKNKSAEMLKIVDEELKNNQMQNNYVYSLPTIKEILKEDRIDTNRFSDIYKKNVFVIKNYVNGYESLSDMGFKAKRGQNLQITCIGESIYSDDVNDDYYRLILSKNITEEGNIDNYIYLGNPNKLSKLKKGELVLSARGNIGRNFVVIEESNDITNIDSIVLEGNNDIDKSIFVHILLNYYRKTGYLSKIAINGSGPESLTIYQLPDILVPKFSEAIKEQLIKKWYTSNAEYKLDFSSYDEFDKYDKAFNEHSGVYNIDKSLKVLKSILDESIIKIALDEEVDTNLICGFTKSIKNN